MNQQKIIIEITKSKNPPKVIVDGEEVSLISLDYHYETGNIVDPGDHKLNLVIPDNIDGRLQTKGIAFDRNVKLD